MAFCHEVIIYKNVTAVCDCYMAVQHISIHFEHGHLNINYIVHGQDFHRQLTCALKVHIFSRVTDN